MELMSEVSTESLRELEEFLRGCSQGVPLKKAIKAIEQKAETSRSPGEANLVLFKNEYRLNLLAGIRNALALLPDFEIGRSTKEQFAFTFKHTNGQVSEMTCDLSSYGHAGDLVTGSQFIRFVPSTLARPQVGRLIIRPSYVVLLIEQLKEADLVLLPQDPKFSAFLCLGFEQRGLKESVAGNLERNSRLKQLYNKVSKVLVDDSGRLLERSDLEEPDFTEGRVVSRFSSCCAFGYKYELQSVPTPLNFAEDVERLLRAYFEAELDKTDFEFTTESKTQTRNSMTSSNSNELLSDQLLKDLYSYRNVILEGVAGTGKSFIYNQLATHFEVSRRVVFHPSTSYEDFLEGIRPKETGFQVTDGAFLEFIKLAAESESSKPFLFVIDEINRANISKVLGDLLLLIEPSKRVPASVARRLLRNEELQDEYDSVKLQNFRTAEDGSSFRQSIAIPENLFILGTMNTTDRSVGTIDLALRRRFVFRRVFPMKTEILKASLKQLQSEDSVNAYDFSTDVDEWSRLNEVLIHKIGIDAELGHSYFYEDLDARKRAPSSPQDSINIWRDQLLPQLAEVLLAFNAVRLTDELMELGLFGGYRLSSEGVGVDRYPIVEPR
jgi:AAA domain (dynein-related subfamily)